MVDKINKKTFEKVYSILKLHQTQKTTPEYQTSTLDGDEFPADLQSMDRTPIQEPANGNKIKLSCIRCDWETGKLKQSKARQRMTAHMFAKHKDDGNTHSTIDGDITPS